METEWKYEGADAVRHVIRSHGTMIVSIPQEVAMRAGLERGVDVRVDQDPEEPGTIVVRAVNPKDRSEDLARLLKEKEAKAARMRAEAEKGAVPKKEPKPAKDKKPKTTKAKGPKAEIPEK